MIKLRQIINKITIDELKMKAKTINHCGDGGDLFYNPKKNAVWWSAGDADTPDKGYTSMEEIKQILKVPGVAHVEIAYEGWPDSDEPGWEPVFYDEKMNRNRYL